MRKRIVPLLAIICATAALPLTISDNPYAMSIAINMLMLAGLASAWNILGGFGGQFSFGHAAYFGAGAYTTMLFLLNVSPDPLLGLLAGIIIATIIALATGSIVFRLRGHYFALASIAVAEIIRLTVLNLDCTGGAQGLLVTDIAIASLNLDGKLPFYYMMLLILTIALVTTDFIRHSKTGFFLLAIREDQDAASALGINTYRYKNIALALSAILTSAIGSTYAAYIRYIDTESVLALHLSIEIILTAIIGGIGTLWGPVLGAIILVPLSEILRSNVIGDTLVDNGIINASSPAGFFFTEILANAHVLIYGIITVACILYFPNGILGLFSQKKRS